MSPLSFDSENLKRLAESMWDSLCLVDREMRVAQWNGAAEALTGFTRAEVVGTRWGAGPVERAIAPEYDCSGGCPLEQTLADGKVREAQGLVMCRDGSRLPVVMRCLPLWDEQGGIAGAVEVFRKRSASPERDALEVPPPLPHVDALTGAFHRVYGEGLLQDAFESWGRRAVSFGVLMLEIRSLDETRRAGSAGAADHILALVGRRIGRSLRAMDRLVRWDDSRLLALLHNVDEVTLEKVAAKLCAINKNTAVYYENAPLSVELAAGGTAPLPDDTCESMLRRAEFNLFRCGSKGTDGFLIG